MYDIRVNTTKNRLYMVLKGFFSDALMKEAADKVIEQIDLLQPGFDIVNDITDFKPASPEGAKEILRGQEYAIKSGVNRIIRVTGEQVIGSMQFQRMAKESGAEGVYVSSLEDAEKLLDQD